MVRPAWADPRYMLLTSWDKPTLLTVGAGLTVLAAKNNPRRWAIGFLNANATPNAVKYTPYKDMMANAFQRSASGDYDWYTILYHGPMVCREWWANSTAGGDLLVIEVEIR